MIGLVEGSISIQINRSTKVQNYFRNNGDREYKHISPNAEFKLKRGDSVQVAMTGTFYKAGSLCSRTYFHGHLVELL